jgi:hypothetical protein
MTLKKPIRGIYMLTQGYSLIVYVGEAGQTALNYASSRIWNSSSTEVLEPSTKDQFFSEFMTELFKKQEIQHPITFKGYKSILKERTLLIANYLDSNLSDEGIFNVKRFQKQISTIKNIGKILDRASDLINKKVPVSLDSLDLHGVVLLKDIYNLKAGTQIRDLSGILKNPDLIENDFNTMISMLKVANQRLYKSTGLVIIAQKIKTTLSVRGLSRSDNIKKINSSLSVPKSTADILCLSFNYATKNVLNKQIPIYEIQNLIDNKEQLVAYIIFNSIKFSDGKIFFDNEHFRKCLYDNESLLEKCKIQKYNSRLDNINKNINNEDKEQPAVI